MVTPFSVDTPKPLWQWIGISCESLIQLASWWMPECMFFTKHKDGKTSLGLSFSESKETDEGLCKQISTTFLDMTFVQMKKMYYSQRI